MVKEGVLFELLSSHEKLKMNPPHPYMASSRPCRISERAIRCPAGEVREEEGGGRIHTYILRSCKEGPLHAAECGAVVSFAGYVLPELPTCDKILDC